jgi:hypothetical protein
MRRLVSIAALALLGAAFIVSTAFAAPVNIVDPTEKTTGALKTYNVNPDRDLDHYETVIATATLDTATSNAIYNVSGDFLYLDAITTRRAATPARTPP